MRARVEIESKKAPCSDQRKGTRMERNDAGRSRTERFRPNLANQRASYPIGLISPLERR